ncbi:MAG: hypothetical protein HLUCCA08_18605 [Rhodobacteraceae bacterium HLUCCA08]|nr:MAG: hypothetical protein HLUCCA08_18605 [Rhodobacteraceae bacterium HLUCCA08]
MTDATQTDAMRFVLDERARCVSDREWKHRLRGYGYDIRETLKGSVLTTLPSGRELGLLPL